MEPATVCRRQKLLIDDLAWAATGLDAAVDEDREAHGKKPLKAKEEAPETKSTKISRTDKDAGYMVREGKPKGFFYLDHRTVDGAHGIITDTHATPGNVHDSRPYLERLDRQREQGEPLAQSDDLAHEAAYYQGVNLYRSRRLDDAVRVYQDVEARWPSGDLSDGGAKRPIGSSPVSNS